MCKTVKIAYQGASAEINLHGAELISYIDAEGREYIWQGDPDVWAQHAPILFPVCGKAKDDQILIKGTAYPMPKHGFACNCDFSVFETGDNYVDLVLVASADTKVMYPFDFALHVIVKIDQFAFTTEFRIENNSDDMMPFCIGGHPGLNFPVSKKPRLTFSSPVVPELDIVIAGGYIQGKEQFSDLVDGKSVTLTHQMIEQRDTLLFSGIDCQTVTLTSTDDTPDLALDFGGFPSLAIWTAGGKYADYICLEPWLGVPASPEETGELSDKPFAVCLPPHESFTAYFIVRKN